MNGYTALAFGTIAWCTVIVAMTAMALSAKEVRIAETELEKAKTELAIQEAINVRYGLVIEEVEVAK